MGTVRAKSSGMDIAYVTARAWPAVGGIETHLRNLSRGLVARGHRVTILAVTTANEEQTSLTESLTPPPPFAPFEDEGVRVRQLTLSPFRRALLAPLAAQVTPLLRRYAWGRARLPAAKLYGRVVAPVVGRHLGALDVLHVMGCGLVGEASVRAARTAGAASVMTPFAHREQWGEDPASAATYRAASRIVALLDADADVYRRLGVPGGRIALCPLTSPGVETGGGAQLREQHAIAGPLVIFLGVRRAYKGFDLLREAVPLVLATRPDVTFAFLGPGPGVDPVDGGRVVDRPEAVHDPERAAWLEAADLLCLPSAGEVMPLSILEAWSVGTGVVTSDIPNLAELVAKSGGGVAAARDPGAIAAAILDALPRAGALGAAGNDWWRRYASVDAVASFHERLYEEVASR
jgi:glycosyltransferase involved in cell wall biosynthesis